MAENIGYAALPVILSFEGARNQIAQGIGAPMQVVARQAGRSAGDAIAAGLAAARSKVERASGVLATARRREEDAAGKVRVAEARLQALRDRGITDAGRLAAAEEKVASARRAASAATNTHTNAAGSLANAQREAAQAAQTASDQTAQHARNVGVLGGAATRAESSMRVLASTAKLAGLAGGGALLADQVKKSLTVGMDYEKSLNTMQAVSTATAGEMAKVAARARELGQAADLPNTSARDAAQAMTELAKGGLSVEQSMKAAKGTLQLAAAAEISAGEAATIQARALQTFGKDGGYAAKAADVLANAANASTAEITDVAQALQAGGLVANQFGLSMEDTAATIGLLANNGVKGSDAGTLLKSALLAVTDQGESAQAAVRKLGLTIYDANGRFVGMHSLLDQLGQAAGRMSEEQYQAAANVLFGSDAMRLAGVAAKDGARGYDQMRIAVDRQGAAADVARAKTQGLPGAWARFKNTVEEAQLSLYDVVKGPASKALDFLAGAPDRLGKLFSSDLMRGDDTANALRSIMDSAKAAAPSLLTIAKSFGQVGGAIGVAGWNVAVTGLQALATALNVVTPPLAGLAGLIDDNRVAATALLAAFLAWKTLPGLVGAFRAGVAGTAVEAGRLSTAANAAGRGVGAFGNAVQGTQARISGLAGSFGQARTGVSNFSAAYRDSVRWMQQANPTTSTLGRVLFGTGQNAATASAHLRVLGSNVAGAATGGLNAVKGAASSVAGVLGGPLGVALTGAAVLGTAWAATTAKQKAITDDYNSSLKELAETQKDTGSKLIASRGAATTEVYQDLTKQVDAYRESVDAAAKNDAKWTDNAKDIFSDVFGGGSWFDNTRTQRMDEAAGRAQVTKKALEDLGVTSEDLGKRLGGSNAEWNSFVGKLRASGDGGRLAAEGLGGLRARFEEQRGQAQRLAPGITQLGDAIRVMGDKTASAGDKINALKAAMDAMNPARSKVEAVAQFAEATKKAGEAAAGLGAVALDQSGSLDGLNANSATLARTLADLADKAGQAASTGADMNVINAQNEATFQRLAAAAGLPVEKIRALYNELGGKTVDLAVRLSGMPETVAGLAKVKATFEATPGQKTVSIASSEVSDETRKQLETIGFTLKDLPGGKVVEVTAKSDAALAQLKAVMDTVTGLPKGADVNVAAPGGQSVLDLLNSIGVKVREGNDKRIEVDAPNAPGVLEKLQALGLAVRSDNGKNVVVTLSGVEAAQAKIRELTQPAVKSVSVQINGQTRTIGTDAQGNRGAEPTMADGGVRAFARGGFTSLPNSAVIQKPIPGLIQWAEPVTQGEAFIPLAQSKRARSTAILAEVARRFGLSLARPMADGGLTVDDVKSFASGITSGKYTWGGAPSSWDTDCSGAQSRVANFITGAKGRFATGSAAGELAKRGFITGDPPPGTSAYVIGWVNGGPGGGHAAGTIVDADGNRTNVEMGGKSGNGGYGAGAAGADEFPNRAWISLNGQGPTESTSGASDFGSASSSGSSSTTTGGGSGSGGGVQKYSLGWWIGRALFGDVPGMFGSGESAMKTAVDKTVKKAVDPRKLREAKDKADDAETKAAEARTALAEKEKNPKTKASALQAAKNRVTKAERDAAQAKTDYEAMQSGASSATTGLSAAKTKAEKAETAAAQARTKLAELEADPKATEAAKTAQRNLVARLERDAAQAKTDSSTPSLTKAGDSTTGDAGGSDLKELTKILGGGVLETFGLDGSWLPDLQNLGIVKMANAIMGIKFTPPPWMEGNEAPPPWLAGAAGAAAPSSAPAAVGPGMALPITPGGAGPVDASINVTAPGLNAQDIAKQVRRVLPEQRTRMAGAVPVGR